MKMGNVSKMYKTDIIEINGHLNKEWNEIVKIKKIYKIEIIIMI